jgi:hypothetical protein
LLIIQYYSISKSKLTLLASPLLLILPATRLRVIFDLEMELEVPGVALGREH